MAVRRCAHLGRLRATEPEPRFELSAGQRVTGRDGRRERDPRGLLGVVRDLRRRLRGCGWSLAAGAADQAHEQLDGADEPDRRRHRDQDAERPVRCAVGSVRGDGGADAEREHEPRQRRRLAAVAGLVQQHQRRGQDQPVHAQRQQPGRGAGLAVHAAEVVHVAVADTAANAATAATTAAVAVRISRSPVTGHPWSLVAGRRTAGSAATRRPAV